MTISGGGYEKTLRRVVAESLVLSVLGFLISAEAKAFHPQQNPNGIRWQSSSSETWSGSAQANSRGDRAELAGTYDTAADTSNALGIAGYFGLFDAIVPPATPNPTLTQTPGDTVTPMPSPTGFLPTPTTTEAPSAPPTPSATGLPATSTPTPAGVIPTPSPTVSPTQTPAVTQPTPTATPSCFITDRDYDLSGDGRVNIDDVILFIHAMRQKANEADFNCDGSTDAGDLFLMARKWEIEVPETSPADAQDKAEYSQ